MNLIFIQHLDHNLDQVDMFYDDVAHAEWAVTNPAWNTRITHLLEHDDIAEGAFAEFVKAELKVKGVQEVYWCHVRDTYMFTTLDEVVS
jgi:hypothetical protein|tara:strand:+ start:409 stop:675 length:267 start_codon:yes stop_codon:yes gene_type:complete